MLSVRSVATQMRCLCLIISLGTLVLQVFGFIGAITSFELSSLLLRVYSALFALIQVGMELNFGFLRRRLVKWVRLALSRARSWWGFLYTYMGRAVFTFVSATLNIATGWWGGYIVSACQFAIVLWASSLLRERSYHILAFALNASFRSAVSCRDDPTLLYSSGEQETRILIQKNPSIAKKAFSVVAQNPSIVQAGTQAYAQNAFVV